MEEDKITVLMPVYNAEKYLHEAIESILNQTYQNFEFLIIDDGSTDDSLNIIRSYNDQRIKLVINKDNLGIVKTLNKGIELAKTELIARMDADDISYTTRLEKQIKFFNESPDCAMIATWATEIDENKEVLFVEKINPIYYDYNLNFECWIYHSTVMYKRNAVIDVGKYISQYAEDFDLWWRLKNQFKLCILPETLLYYRTSFNSLSRVTHKQEYTDAHLNLMLRNIHYYTGSNFQIKDYEAEFLCSRLEKIIKKDKKSILSCFQKLDDITKFIIEREPSNEILIKKSLAYKKKRLIYGLRMYLDKWTIVKLLIKLSNWKELYLVLKQYAKNSIKKYSLNR